LELKADAVRLRDVEELDELAPDTVDPLDVVLGACPELDAVDLRAETDDGAADLVALVELLADERHGEPLPALVEQRRVVLHCEHPLAAIRIRLVLPHRLDARLEQVVVRVTLQLGRRLQPVEVPAVRLNSFEIAHSRQTGLVRSRIGRSRVRAVRGGHGRIGHSRLGVVIYRPV
jgi:hypothetical protein